MKQFFLDIIKPKSVRLNFLRDIVWTYITFNKYGIDLKPTSDVQAQFLGQWLYPTLVMAPASLIETGISRIFFHKNYLQELAIAGISASLGIPGWNEAGLRGQQFFEYIGLNSMKAGYLSAFPSGFAEGPIQELSTCLLSLLFVTDEKNLFKQNPKKYMKTIGEKILFCLKKGWISGTVWQLVAQACQTNDVNLYISVFAVAACVAICNAWYAKCYDERFDRIHEQKLPQEAKTSSWWSYLFPAQTHQSINTDSIQPLLIAQEPHENQLGGVPL